MTTTPLSQQRCVSCSGATPPLSAEVIAQHLQALNGWSIEACTLCKTYRFSNYHESMAFVNASAWISHREDHHPDITLGYNQCTVRYITHAIGGLSENDFICAAKLDALFAL